MEADKISPRLWVLFVALIICLALFLRWPFVGQGMPFFYREDEAHHFNRVVNMMKSGDLNPHYFHKPSLHFYLRLPVMAGSFLWTVRAGNIRSVQEIVTRDPFGVGDYAFSASHPGIVKWNRAFSVLLSIGLVYFAIALAAEASLPRHAQLIAGMLTAVSPALIADSAVIGVDMPMSFFCLWAAYLSVRLSKEFSVKRLLWCGLVSGLAVSCKYNAAPIALLPLLVTIFSARRSAELVAAAALLPAAGFLIGSPYIISSIPLFLDQLAYEVWHYGVAVREGQTAEPGLPQALFYLRWLTNDAMGILAVLLALVGFLKLIATCRRVPILFMAFPVMYLALMISQRTNFPRNVLVIIPFVAVCSAIGFEFLRKWIQGTEVSWRKPLSALLLIAASIAIIWPLGMAWKESQQAFASVDSRTLLQADLGSVENRLNLAVSGQLQLPPSILAVRGITRIDEKAIDPLNAFSLGYDAAALSSFVQRNLQANDFFTVEKVYNGIAGPQRIVSNPLIYLIRFKYEQSVNQLLERVSAHSDWHKLTFTWDGRRFVCGGGGGEDYCWSQNRIVVLEMAGHQEALSASKSMRAEIMTPWENQEVRILYNGSRSEIVSPDNNWQEYSMQLNGFSGSVQSPLLLETKIVRSPKSWGLGEDGRRLGVAIRYIEFGK